jgi:hypothetical protein
VCSSDLSEWFIFPDSHPPIVSKEDFSKVQEILTAPKEVISNGRERSKQSKKLFHHVESGDGKYNANLYGYRINTSGSWDVDDTAADVVRTIFNLALEGHTPRDIADMLQEKRCVPPGEYFKLIRGKDVQVAYRWPNLRVREILKNEQYTGTYIAGRTFQDQSGRKYHTPKSEWIIIPDKHPAIVTKEIFDQVQAVMSQGKRKMQPHNYLLRGKIICGCCNRAMIYGNTTLQPMYRCMNTHADEAAACHKYKVSTAEVEDAVMSIIKIQAGVILASDDLTDLRKANGGKGQLAEYEKQIAHLMEQRQTIYEQFVTGETDRDTYRTVKTDLTAQIERLRNMVSSLKQSEIENHAKSITAEQAKSVFNEAITPRELVDALIEKIYVFPNNHLEIKWKVAGFSAS